MNPQMDVLYMQNLGHVLGIFTRNAEPSSMETTPDAFVVAGDGFHLRRPFYTSMSISKDAVLANQATLTVQVQGEVPSIGDVISVQGTSNQAGEFNVTAKLTGITLSASGAGTVSYPLTAANAATAADSGSAIVLSPNVIDFVIPLSLIGVFRTDLSPAALASPLTYTANPPSAPTGVQAYSGGAVAVGVSPLTITPPASATGNVLILIEATTPGVAPIQLPPVPIPSPVVAMTPTLPTLDHGTYRAIVFVPGFPIAVSGSFTV